MDLEVPRSIRGGGTIEGVMLFVFTVSACFRLGARSGPTLHPVGATRPVTPPDFGAGDKTNVTSLMV